MLTSIFGWVDCCRASRDHRGERADSSSLAQACQGNDRSPGPRTMDEWGGQSLHSPQADCSGHAGALPGLPGNRTSEPSALSSRRPGGGCEDERASAQGDSGLFAEGVVSQCSCLSADPSRWGRDLHLCRLLSDEISEPPCMESAQAAPKWQVVVIAIGIMVFLISMAIGELLP